MAVKQYFKKRVKSKARLSNMYHNIAYLRQVLQYFGVCIVMTSQTIIGLRQFSHTINWSL
jgi:ribosomal protein S8